MNKENVIDFIKEKSVVTIPLIQEEFGLSYVEVKKLFDELTEKKDLKYIGGIEFQYKKTKPMPSMFVTIEPKRTLDERVLESLKRACDELVAQDNLLEHKDDDERKKTEISDNSEFIDSGNIDDSCEEEDFEDFDSDNELDIELSLLELFHDESWNEIFAKSNMSLKIVVAETLASDISKVCNVDFVDKWARDYSIYLMLEEASGKDERKNAPHHNFWDNVYLFAMAIKELFEVIVSNDINISKADAISKVEGILKGFLPRRNLKKRQVCERLIYDLKNMTDERFIYLKNYLS